MTDPPTNSPTTGSLGQTQTDWALLYLAHAAIPDDSREAWTQLVLRYAEPVRGSLRRLVRDAQLADDLNQEFWVRFLRGDFAHATPTRGRFRNLIKTVLIHLVVSHFRQAKREVTVGFDLADGFALAAHLANHHVADWRQELIDRALTGLDLARSGQICPEVLDIEVENAGRASPEKAALFGRKAGREVSAEYYRQILHRTRAKFAELLVEEVRRSLTDPTPDAVREELAELDLLRYCDPDPAE